jgi:uncharacterized protein (TIGR02246 family)
MATLVCAVAGCGPTKKRKTAEDADRIRELDERWQAAAARRDLQGMMSIYAPDAQELLPGTPAIVGRSAIRDFYARLIEANPRFLHDFEMAEIVVAGSSDLAVVRGTYRFTPDSLRPGVFQVGKFVGIWRKSRDDWRLHVNISNADADPLGK